VDGATTPHRTAGSCYATRMGETSAAVLRRFHEAWTRGDLGEVLTLVEDDVVVHPLHGALFSTMEFRGREGIEQWYREMTDPWDRFEAIVEDARDTPEGAIGVLLIVGYRGEQGFHARVGVVCEMRDGRIATLDARNAGEVEARLREP
jgi:ketosteroid isomerase-like protein